MKNIWKNISGIVPVILAAVVGIGAVVSLSDYTAGEVISVRQKLQKKMVQSSKWHIIQEQPLVC